LATKPATIQSEVRGRRNSMPHKEIKRGFKTLATLRRAKKARKLAKQLRKTRGAETSGVRSEGVKRAGRKARARKLIKKMSK